MHVANRPPSVLPPCSPEAKTSVCIMIVILLATAFFALISLLVRVAI